jgi:hypothetical protein
VPLRWGFHLLFHFSLSVILPMLNVVFVEEKCATEMGLSPIVPFFSINNFTNAQNLLYLSILRLM